MPAASSESPSSASLQSMPSLTTPPISRLAMVRPFDGRCAPSGASTTTPPGAGTLGAPQMTSCVPPPRSTVTSRRPLLVGCGRVETTQASTHDGEAAPYSETASTSRPAAVNRCAS